jgi:hypothetical protein
MGERAIMGEREGGSGREDDGTGGAVVAGLLSILFLIKWFIVKGL